MNETVNEVVVTGRIMNVVKHQDGTVGMTVYSMGGEPIYPTFQMKQDMVPQGDSHQSVKITGHVDVYRAKNHDGKFTTRQVFVADKVEKPKTLVEERFNVPGRFVGALSSACYLKGKIKRNVKDGEWYRMAVTVNAGKQNESIAVDMRELDRQPVIKEGDTVYIVCTISTRRRKLPNGKVMHYENLIVSDIAVYNPDGTVKTEIEKRKREPAKPDPKSANTVVTVNPEIKEKNVIPNYFL